MAKVLKPFVLACYDTSLGAGRLSADWVPALNAQIRDFPEAVGPVYVYNRGHGGWTSNDLLSGVGDVINLKPTHLLTELGAINDCADLGSGPAVSLATKNANNQQMLQALLAGVPGIDITVMTMSSVSLIQTGRTQLGTYYGAELATAQAQGVGQLDLYSGWPKPLALNLTHQTNPLFPTAYPPPSGFTGLGGGWDPNASCTAAEIGQDGVTFAGNAGGGSTVPVIGTLAMASGRGYAQLYDIREAAGANTNGAFGLATAGVSMAVGQVIGDEAHGWGLRQSGGVWNANNSIGSGPTWGQGDVVMMAWDLDAHKLWFGKNGTWTGDPAAGTGGITIPAGTYYAAANLRGAATSGVYTADFLNGYDGLHPIWTGAVDTYLFPPVVNLVRQKMAAFWS